MPGKKNTTWMLEPDELDRVSPEYGCPRCLERRVDYLVWTETDQVTCHTCQFVYTPPSSGQTLISDLTS